VAQVSDRVRRLRKEAGLTQEEVARRAQLTLQSYGSIERGHVRDPHLSSLEAIARALGVPVEELIKEPVPLDDAPPKTGPKVVKGAAYVEVDAETFEILRALLVDREISGAEAKERLDRIRMLILQ
jgi:transcriptional regulator with XRE-family HTH domain